MLIIHKIASWFFSRQLIRIENYKQHPIETQEEILFRLIQKGGGTSWGEFHNYNKIKTLAHFQELVPVSSYEDIFPWIERSIQGEESVLWPGKIDWFAKSSGTTNDRSKFIPVTKDSMEYTHFQGGKDMIASYLDRCPESRLFAGRSISIAGSHEPLPIGTAHTGDLSAVLLENLSFFFEYVRKPSKKVALMSEWESKLDAMAEELASIDITAFAGVPTWVLVLIHKVFEKKGITNQNLLEVWPNLELFFHGGVNFDPYRAQFEQLIPSTRMKYLNVYNASEGIFAFQDDFDSDDMLLMLDYGVFFEFIPLKEVNQAEPQVVSLSQVEVGKVYAMLISTIGGLWRYNLGDTIEFTSIFPFRIKIAGRTKQFINAFGEELMVDNAERALSFACQQTGAQLINYTAAPIYFEGTNGGGHEWLVEFNKAPNSLEKFTHLLDSKLKELNSDYDAKRYKELALQIPLVKSLPVGTFYQWMKIRKKLGGQNKVPRLANDRKYVESILEMLGRK